MARVHTKCMKCHTKVLTRRRDAVAQMGPDGPVACACYFQSMRAAAVKAVRHRIIILLMAIALVLETLVIVW